MPWTFYSHVCPFSNFLAQDNDFPAFRDWFPRPLIWAIIVKFDQIRKNWWRISCAEILEVGKKFFAASSVKKMSRFEEVSREKIKRIAWKFTKTVILLGLAGYELIITNSAYGLVSYISSYPVHPRRITVKYYLIVKPTLLTLNLKALNFKKKRRWKLHSKVVLQYMGNREPIALVFLLF